MKNVDGRINFDLRPEINGSGICTLSDARVASGDLKVEIDNTNYYKADENITFDNDNTYTIGTSGLKFKEIHCVSGQFNSVNSRGFSQGTNQSVVNKRVHQGRRDNFAGNNGMGQSAGAHNVSAPLASGSFSHGKGSDAFWGCCFDGESIWLVPFASDDLVKVNLSDGSMTSYVHGKGSNAFIGACFDGESIWLAPLQSDDLVKVDPSDGSMISYSHGKGVGAFYGACFDGESVWLAPYNSDDVAKVNPSDGSMTSYAHGKGDYAFAGACFDGESIWLVPRQSDDLVKVDLSDGSMTLYAHGKSNYAFAGACFDGESIWLVPFNSNDLVKVNPSDGSMVSYAHGKGNGAFYGCCFDGESVWLAPHDSDSLVKVDPPDGSMTSYVHGKGNSAFAGVCFDGESVWLAPRGSSEIVKFTPPEFGRPSLHTTGPLNVGGQTTLASGLHVEGNVTASGFITGVVNPYSEIVDLWNPSGALYYSDINHNLNTTKIETSFTNTANGESCSGVEYDEIIDKDNLRLFVSSSGLSVRATIM